MSKAIALIIIAGLMAGAVILGVLFIRPGITNGRTSLCQSCFVNEPVVDVILPALAKNSGGGVSTSNAPLNITRGSTQTLEVQVYPTIDVSVKLVFRVLFAPVATNSSSTSWISATFTPGQISVASQKRGVSTLSLSVSSIAPLGTYNAAVSAEETTNTSVVWGTFFMTNVSG